MSKKAKQYSAQEKAKEAMEAMVLGFSSKPKAVDTSQTELIGQLYQQIGQLTVERDWLKKKSGTFGFGS
jgi:transposase